MITPAADLGFLGPLPTVYQSHLVPLILEPYASDLGTRRDHRRRTRLPPRPPLRNRRAGKVANLLLLRSNPLKTVEAYDAIDLVVVRGNVIERPALAAP
jgi:hypothetical protein